MTIPSPPLLLITDRTAARRPLADVVTAAFDAGCRWIMVREKDLCTDVLADFAAEIVTIGRRFAATVTVNGDAVAARNGGAHGVHLPQGYPVAEARSMLGDHAVIGVSAHSEEETAVAARAGADYVTLSPVFESASKPGYGPALGLDEVGRIAAVTSIPVLALGGVTAATARQCVAAGAGGVAVMGSVMRANDPASVVDGLLRQLERAYGTMGASHQRRPRHGRGAIS